MNISSKPLAVTEADLKSLQHHLNVNFSDCKIGPQRSELLKKIQTIFGAFVDAPYYYVVRFRTNPKDPGYTIEKTLTLLLGTDQEPIKRVVNAEQIVKALQIFNESPIGRDPVSF